MAETKVINLEVKDNSEKAAKGFKNLNKEIKNTESSVKDTESASKELGSATNSITGGMLGKFKGLYTSVQTVIRGMNFLKLAIIGTGLGALLIAIVSIKQAFTSSEEGQNKFAKLLGVIGAVVGNLLDLLSDLGEFLIDVFTNPIEYIKKFAQLIKENIVNRFNGLLELIPQLGKAVSALFKGNFSEAGKIATNAVAKVTLGVDDLTEKIKGATEATKAFIEEQIREAKIAGQIADDRAKADKLERGLIVQRAKADRDIADLREKAINRELYSTRERIAFLEEAQRIEDAITIKEIKAAKLRRDAKIEENKLSKSNKEELKEEEELKAKVIELETRSLLASKTLTKGIQTLRAEDAADFKSKQAEKQKIIDDAKAKKKEQDLKDLKDAEDKAKKEIEIADKQYDLLQETTNSKFEQEIFLLNKQYDAKFELAMGNAELEKALEEKQRADILDINNRYRAEKKAAQDIIDKAEEEANKKKLADEKKLQEQKQEAVKSTLSSISNLAELFAGKSEAQQKRAFKIQKAVNIAQATIDTYKAANLALASAPPPLSFAFAGAAITAGLLNVKKIASQQFSGGASSGGGGGGGSTPNLSTPQSVQPNFNIVGDSGVNQLDALKSQPSKVYVVSGEVSSAQALDRNRQRNATL